RRWIGWPHPRSAHPTAGPSRTAVSARRRCRASSQTRLHGAVLVLDEVINGGMPVEPAQSRSLEPTLLRADIHLRPVIDKDAACLQRPGDAQGAIDIARPDAR